MEQPDFGKDCSNAPNDLVFLGEFSVTPNVENQPICFTTRVAALDGRVQIQWEPSSYLSPAVVEVRMFTQKWGDTLASVFDQLDQVWCMNFRTDVFEFCCFKHSYGVMVRYLLFKYKIRMPMDRVKNSVFMQMSGTTDTSINVKLWSSAGKFHTGHHNHISNVFKIVDLKFNANNESGFA